MIFRLAAFGREVRRWISRTEWAIRLLGLSRPAAGTCEPGLVMLQIDGLSEGQLRTALARGRMPFLSQLLGRENYSIHPHYSGLPSNTPAVQGELFYGVRTCVPAFCYVDRKSGRLYKMYAGFAARDVEKRLESEGAPLLQGGASYSNVFTGGAAEPHFCASHMGFGALKARPWAFPFVVLLYFDVLVRVFVLLSVEIALGFLDGIRGTFTGKLFLKEFEFIPSRVAVCILLREIVAVGVRLDIARGLPVIHANLLGYDEQSHRRGPTSEFAHWSLRGIDDAIGRIWKAAHRSAKRHYDVWVYSDHGQEDTIPYVRHAGMELESAVEKALQGGQASGRSESEGVQSRRAEYFREGSRGFEPPPAENPEKLVVAAMGPVAHVYPPQPLETEHLEAAARRLVTDAKIPIVIAAQGGEEAAAWTAEGRFSLPQDAAKLFGDDHPFLEEMKRDAVALAKHPDSGALVLCGWRRGQPAVTFPLENGSHAGFGAQETNGFALLPEDAPVAQKPYLRPTDLREAAFRALGRAPLMDRRRGVRTGRATQLRVMTYNVHGCVGMDGKLSPERIARVIARQDADVVALQELDVGRSRSGHIDQVEAIARKLEMFFHFHPTFVFEDEKYGNAFLSRYPMYLVKMEALPRSREAEPRGALWVTLDVDGKKVQLLNCHLSIWPRERLMQATALVGDDWCGRAAAAGPIILCGDFNASPKSPAYRRLASSLKDSQLHLNEHQPHRTWFGRYPLGRIDHVFIGEGIEVESIRVPRTEMEKAASDHLPLVVDLRISDAPPAPDESSVPEERRSWVVRRKKGSDDIRIERESRKEPRRQESD